MTRKKRRVFTIIILFASLALLASSFLPYISYFF